MNYLMFELLKTSIFISIPIILIALLKNKILCKYTHKLNYIICILITIRMLFISSIGVYLPFENNIILESVHSIKKSGTNNIVNYIKIIFCIWLFGVIYIVIKNICKQILFYKKIQNINHIVTDTETIKILEEEKKALNIRKYINISKVDGLSSPALIGIIKNKIIIPNNDYDKEQLKWIFRHELIHFKRKDNLLKLILMIASAIHWFNPLVKILKVYFGEQCELSCDEKVIKRFSKDEIKEYAFVLVNTLKYRNTLKTTMFSSQFNTNGVDIIKGRVESMLSSKKRKKGTFLVVFLLFISALSVISFNNTIVVQAGETSLYSSESMNNGNVINLCGNTINLYEDREYENLTQEEKQLGIVLFKTGKYSSVTIGSDFSLAYALLPSS
ncbi:M56 family metallopeptidase [Clostridium senegalense]|uniref:M56 family metallopeptidase n=2 Tax=Clostridium senegalense TaxID=1465809 RepID=UPI0002D77573|nr:M56 family metallopeptidase [Clostridium senegalense]